MILSVNYIGINPIIGKYIGQPGSQISAFKYRDTIHFANQLIQSYQRFVRSLVVKIQKQRLLHQQIVIQNSCNHRKSVSDYCTQYQRQKAVFKIYLTASQIEIIRNQLRPIISSL